MSWCDTKLMTSWSDEEIVDWYDSHPDLTISSYAKQLEITISELKWILQNE